MTLCKKSKKINFVNMMRSVAVALTAAVVLAGSTDRAEATTLNGTLAANSVDYFFFDTDGSSLDISVSGFDSMFAIFVDDGSLAGALTGALAFGPFDDGGGSTTSTSNAGLSIGSYVLALGEWDLTETEARSGVASTPGGDRNYSITFGSAASNISPDVALPPTPVPLPAGLPLLLVGLGSFALVRRRAA